MVVIGKIKGYKLRVISKRKAQKAFLEKDYMEISGCRCTKDDILEVYAGKGRVYGVYDSDKNMVGAYIFERVADYFHKNSEKQVHVHDLQIDMDTNAAENSLAAFRLKKAFDAGISEEAVGDIKEAIMADLRDQIEMMGAAAGVEWDEQVHYKKALDAKHSGLSVIGYVLGFAIGAAFGIAAFKTPALGLCWGAAFSPLFGLLFSVGGMGSEEKTRWSSIVITK